MQEKKLNDWLINIELQHPLLCVSLCRQRDIDVLIGILNDFNVLSSAKLNWNKSESILVGDWKGEGPRLLNIWACILGAVNWEGTED